jgi:catechol 2,3-dioxygenase-like lactoylglutathione lyase family enzyme
MSTTVLDHFAIGADALTDGWELFGGVLGGTWVTGGQSRGFWWGQLAFGRGPKIELITPTGGPDAAFLERFLAARGPGPHHCTFLVPDIEATLVRVKAAGIEPVQVDLQSVPRWKEAFLHPRDAHGIVVQLAEQSAPPPATAVPKGLPDPGPSSAFALIEHQVHDLTGATAMFTGLLAGEIVAQDASATDLAWENGARLRLVARDRMTTQRPGGAGALHFRRDAGNFGPDDLSRAADLARRLGVMLELDS